MTQRGDPRQDDRTSRPVLFIVDVNDEARAITASALERRFGADYRVLSAESCEVALDVLQQLAQHGDQVALVAVELHMPDIDGLEFLDRAQAMHRDISRVLLLEMDQYRTRIPFTQLETLQRATALGRIDFFVVKGWVSPEEWLYPQVQEALTAWTNAHRPRHVVYRIVGEQWDPRTYELRDMMTRNGVPFAFCSRDSEEGRRLLREFSVDSDRLPALIHDSGAVLHEPTFFDIAHTHGIATEPPSETYDLAVLGAGPAGLAAAVYGASEGLRTLVIEPLAIGGQAGTSSMIRNYLGFPRGTSGGELAHRAWQQAILFRAEFLFGHAAIGLCARGADRVIELLDNGHVTARSVIVAVGVTYRRLDIPSLDRLTGTGVYYGAAGVEATAMAGEQVYVVGGANSAGQAALHLAKFAAHVTLVVRGASLAAGMSDYLITQINATDNIDVRLRTYVVDGRGANRLESLTLEDADTHEREEVPAAGLFVLIGAEPHTQWLRDTVQQDDRGYIVTDRDVSRRDLAQPADRAPLPFETSLPGVFAVGDVRHGSVKRVAGAAGEGSVAVGSVHQYLADHAAGVLAAGDGEARRVAK
jgi:thioredoxin reductase (NADPH)